MLAGLQHAVSRTSQVVLFILCSIHCSVFPFCGHSSAVGQRNPRQGAGLQLGLGAPFYFGLGLRVWVQVLGLGSRRVISSLGCKDIPT